MKVLVVGGTRFLGHELAWRLLAAGHELTLFNRGTLSDAFGARVERLRGDRTGPDFARLLAGRSFDAAVDFAAYDGEDGRRAVEVLDGRVGHYVVISTGQVYLVREGRPSPAREADYDGPLLPEPRDAVRQGPVGLRHGQARARGRARRGVGEDPLPGDAPAHPDGERPARPLPPDRALPVADAGRRPRAAARRRRAPRAPRLLGLGRAGDRVLARPRAGVRPGVQPRAGRDADARRAAPRAGAGPRRAGPARRRPARGVRRRLPRPARAVALLGPAGCPSSTPRGRSASSASRTSRSASTSRRSWPRSWPTRRRSRRPATSGGSDELALARALAAR